MHFHEFEISLFAATAVLIGFFGIAAFDARAQGVGPSGCVEHPDYPCGGPSGSGGFTRTYVDPEVLAARRAAKEAKRREAARVREVRKRNRTPYRGITQRQKRIRGSVAETLWRVGNPVVKSVTYERFQGVGGQIFVPGNDLGNIALARPVSPTLRETRVAVEQLAKAGAVLNFSRSNSGSAEDRAFLADQAAQIMIGGRSYVHVVVSGLPEYRNNLDQSSDSGATRRPAGEAFMQDARDVTELLDDIASGQIEIRSSENERAQLMESAKGEIRELAALTQQILKAKGPKKREKMQERARELAANLDELEAQYFSRIRKEKALQQQVSGAARQLKKVVRWLDD